MTLPGSFSHHQIRAGLATWKVIADATCHALSLLGAHDDLWEVPPPGWCHGYPPCVISNHGSASQELIAYVWIESMGESKTSVNKAGSLSHGFLED